MSQKWYYTIVWLVALSLIARVGHADLVAHWALDEGSGVEVLDSSGNDRNGSFVGEPQWVTGLYGGALAFDGGAHYVDMGTDLPVTDEFTMTVWIKMNPDNADQYIGVGGRLKQSGSYGGFSLVRHSSNVFRLWVCYGADLAGSDSAENYTDTEWHHLAGVRRNGTNYLYVDGVEQPDPVSDNFVQSDGIAHIGRQYGDYEDRYWNGLIDDVRIYDHAMSEVDVLGTMEGEPWPYAFGPEPANGALHNSTWINLSWKAGEFAVSHDVYLGDNYDDVSNATPDSDVFRGNQIALYYVAGVPGFAFPDGLVPGTTYYWRIDEVNDTNAESPWKGPVWRFSIPPKTAYDPDPPNNAENVGPERVQLSWTPGYGAKFHTVFIGDDYDEVNNAVVGSMQGTPTFNAGTLETEKVFYWRVDEFDAVETHKGDIWTFTTPGAVGAPKPADSGTGVAMTTSLSWTAATNATSHEVYFGLDKEAVRNADTSSPEYQGSAALGSENIDPGKLAWHTLYFWRVDAVTNAGTVKGPIWSFTTADFIAIDDFESYTDDDAAGEAIWQSWIDGFGVADNGAQAGNLLPPYAEQTVVHGGVQSMPLTYINEDGVTNSEATLTLTTRDWTEEDVGELSLWVRGSAVNAAEPLYVTVANAAGAPVIKANEDPLVAQKGNWTQWVIPLQTLADQGIILTDVDKIAIGLGSKSGMAAAGGTGTMYIDDIALFR